MGSCLNPPLLVHYGRVRTDSSTALVTASRHDVKEHLPRLRSWLGGLPMGGISAYLILVALFWRCSFAGTLIGYRASHGVTARRVASRWHLFDWRY